MSRFGMLLLVAIVSLTSTDLFAQLRSPLISELAARRYGLTRPWFAQVDLDRNRDRLQSITIHDDMLFAQTKRGVIHAFDAETGKTIWVNRIGSPMHPTTSVGISRQYVAALNGSSIYVLERDTGKYAWNRRVIGAPGAGPGVSRSYVFVPTTNGILEAYDLESPRKPAWLYNAGGRALVQPLVTSSSVSFPTDRGLFYVAGANNLSIRYRTVAGDDIVAQAAHIPPFFYVPSLDGNLYKVHERSGKIAWRFTTGEPVSEKPIAINGRIYITAQGGGLFCVLGDTKVAMEAAAAELRAAADRGEIPADQIPEPDPPPVDEGTEIWWTPGIERLLAVTPTRVYGLDRTGRLRICRADTGSPITSMEARQVSMSVINHVSDRLYLGTDTGFIQCLHEPQIKEPLSYVIQEDDDEDGPVPAPKDEVLAGKDQGADLFGGGADAAGGDADPFAADPFGGGGDKGGDDADPFGADPFGGGAGGNDDPFGGGGDAGGNDDPFGGGGNAGGDNDPFGDPFN